MFIMIDRPLSRYLALFLGVLLALPWHMVGIWAQGAFLFGSTLFLTFALMPLLIRFAHYIDALDYPDARRVHAQPTPRIGGLAVMLAVNISLLLNLDFSLAFKGVCLSALIVALISFWDDLRAMPALFKLIGQVVAIAVLIYCDVVIQFAPETWWGDWLEYGVTAFWMLGITNAFNFLDGINGLASSLALATCLLMAILAWHTGQSYMLFLCLALAGGAAGFLPDNARYDQPARCFLGDVGSTYLGWMMAGIAVMGDWSSDGAIKAYSAPLLIFSVMIFDMIYTTIARFKRGDVHNFKEWIEFVGKDHLHHRLMDLGCSQAQAVLVIVSFSLVMGLSALALIKGSMITVVLLLIQAVLFYLILSFLMTRTNNNRG